MTNEKGVLSLMSLHALMRAQYWMYQTSHWQAKGSSFYGDHLLFQRLYESMSEQVDTLAEKLVGIFGPEHVMMLESFKRTAFWVEAWSQIEDLHERGLQSEKDFQRVVRETYDAMEEEGSLTLGLDDFLAASASDHEANVYLLKQVLGNKT